MDSETPLAVGPIDKAKRFNVNREQMSCMDSGGHRRGRRDIPGGSAITERRVTPAPCASGNGQHTGLWAQSGREPFQLSSIWDTPVSHAAEQFLEMSCPGTGI